MLPIDDFLGAGLSKFIVAVLTVTGIAAVLLWMHWQLALFILLMNPLVIYFTVLLGKRVKTLKRHENSAFELFQQALHPYTEALLKSLPENYSATNRRMESIIGTQPAAGEMLPGCGFQPRCKYARELCSRQKPVLNTIEKNSPRTVRCFYPLVSDNASGNT